MNLLKCVMDTKKWEHFYETRNVTHKYLGKLFSVRGIDFVWKFLQYYENFTFMWLFDYVSMLTKGVTSPTNLLVS